MRRFGLRGLKRLSLSLFLIVGMLAGLAPGAIAGPQDGPGNNGTVKIHESPGEPSPIEQNQSRVCEFHIHGFFFDSGQTIDWAIYSWPPTGDGTLVASGSFVADEEGEGWSEDMTLPDGHYRLEADPQAAPGDQKHKMFWVECEAEAEVEGEEQAQVLLEITKDDSADPIEVGDTLTYTITVTSQGQATATGVVVVDALPEGVGFVSASEGCEASEGVVTCTVGELEAGAAVVLSIEVTVEAAGTLTNLVEVSAAELEEAPQAEETTQVVQVVDAEGEAETVVVEIEAQAEAIVTNVNAVQNVNVVEVTPPAAETTRVLGAQVTTTTIVPVRVLAATPQTLPFTGGEAARTLAGLAAALLLLGGVALATSREPRPRRIRATDWLED